MATILLSAAGMAAGSAIGGSVLGLSTAVLGRAIGATIGRVIDQKLLGAGQDPVEQGKVDRFRLTGASEGTGVAQMHGRARVAGQVIWATQFKESVSTSGGKGGPPKPEVKEYSYSVSLAIALCRGEISGVGRVWADGQELAADAVQMRVYTGAEDQLPDSKIEAVEGAGMAPAYRGIAYVVLEDVELGQFGNRVPQFNFEVFRPAPEGLSGVVDDPARAVKAVTLIPGTGEYSLATTPVHFEDGPGRNRSANVNAPAAKPDLLVSLDALRAELPNCAATSLVVSWFGDDLRCGSCSVAPKVEQTDQDGQGMAWQVSSVTRGAAGVVPLDAEDRPVYGGTPSDASVIEGIQALQAAGQAVTFYPFILMEQMSGNGLTDPWTGAADQPALPWRGRITLSVAPGQPGSPDGSAAADAEVAGFFGTAQPSDFMQTADGVDYTGPAEWSFRRFILHYANLCAVAGGVEAFCIGSEMRSLTQIRGASGFPAVQALKTLAAEVRAILGPACKIGYAADWSEYFGYHPQDGSGDVYFHLDPLWGDANVDFVGIDNYMPLSDWRDGDSHADFAAGWESIYDLDYLRGNIDGGEGYDWYYASDADRDAQVRTPIADGAHGEPWVYRYKDLKSWWGNAHHERIGGVRQASPTAWVPESKPIWFTEYGCAAIDKGTNQPNKFLDPKSSESSMPHYSSGGRDDFIQMQYLRAFTSHYAEAVNNPVSGVYAGPMVDMGRAHVWAWDARPYPFFPGRDDLWSDGDNYARGHWLNGRAASRSLQGVVAEVCLASGVEAYDVSRLYGLVRGYAAGSAGTGRAELQPLMLAYGFDAVERGGVLEFRSRDGRADAAVARGDLALPPDAESDLSLIRAPEAETAGRLRLSYIEADADYETRAEEAIFPDEATRSVAGSELALVLTRAEARGTVERWLAESRVARDVAKFALPMSRLALGAGDVVTVEGRDYRIDRVELGEHQEVEAVRVESALYHASDAVERAVRPRPFVAPVPVYPLFLDLPLLRGDEVPHAPHVAATAWPWPRSVAVYDAASDSGYALNRVLQRAAVVGVTETPLVAAAPGVIDRGAALTVKLVTGALASASLEEVLAGANVAAVGDGTAGTWEVFQFTDAVLVGERTWEVSRRLRGQAGTDGVMPANWPAGSVFVLLDGSAAQIDLALSNRGLERHYRIGPAQRSYDDPAFLHRVEVFDGIGLRPYAPAHLRMVPVAAGGAYTGDFDHAVTWVRRTRIDGDSWQGADVPLGEESEAYTVRILQGGNLMREASTSTPSYTYSAADRDADGVTGTYEIDVAQVSAQFGPGLFRRIVIDG